MFFQSVTAFILGRSKVTQGKSAEGEREEPETDNRNQNSSGWGRKGFKASKKPNHPKDDGDEQQLNKAWEDAPNPNLVLAKSQLPHGSFQKPNCWYSEGAARRESSLFPPLPIPSCLLMTFSSCSNGSPEPMEVWAWAGPPRASLCCSLQRQKDTWENTTYNAQPHT